MRDTGRARIILALLLLTAFTLITLDYRSGGGGPLRRVGNAVFGPIENAVGSVARPVGSFFSSLSHLSSYKHDNDKLRAELKDEQRKNRLHDADEAQLKAMQALLHLDQLAQFTTVSANVVAVGSSLGFESTATIDVGSRDGVTANETVVNGDGLVGRTLSVGPYTSTVLLGNDPKFAVGARLEATQEIGFVQGAGRRPMSFRLLDSQATIDPGARLVTWGDIGNKPFVAEVPIGHITKVDPPNGALTRTAVVAPYVRFSTLDVVGVVVGVGTPPRRDSLLPPRPRPTPSGTPTPATPPRTPGTPPASVTPGASPSSRH